VRNLFFGASESSRPARLQRGCQLEVSQHRSWSLSLKRASRTLAISNPQTCLPQAGEKMLRFLYSKSFRNATTFF
jgi:hypothetical protein